MSPSKRLGMRSDVSIAFKLPRRVANITNALNQMAAVDIRGLIRESRSVNINSEKSKTLSMYRQNLENISLCLLVL